MNNGITFANIRRFFSRIDLISITMVETGQYENFSSIKDVPDSYNDKYLYGIGLIESEFSDDDNIRHTNKYGFRFCIEIALSEKKREDL